MKINRIIFVLIVLFLIGKLVFAQEKIVFRLDKSIISKRCKRKASIRFKWDNRNRKITSEGSEPISFLLENNEIVLLISSEKKSEFSIYVPYALESNELFKVELDFRSSSIEFDFINRLNLDKIIDILGESHMVTYAKPGLTYSEDYSESEWGKLTFYWLSQKKKTNRLNFVFEGVDDRFKKETIEIKNLTISIIKDIAPSNLIPNGDFELFHQLPNRDHFGTYFLENWQCVGLEFDDNCYEELGKLLIKEGVSYSKDQSHIILGTPDHQVSSFFNSFDERNIKASSGIGFAHIYADEYGVTNDNNISTGEYLQVKLKSGLQMNQWYVLSLDIRTNSANQIVTNGIGVKFTKCPFEPFDPNHLIKKILPEADYMLRENCIKDTNWSNITITFRASGEEEYLTLGLFNNPLGNQYLKIGEKTSNRAQYLIDNIKLERKVEKSK